MKKRSTNPRMAMMMGRAMRRPALAANPALSVNPAVAQPAVNPMAAMASAPTMKKGGKTMKSCATKSDAKMIAKKEVKGHEKSMHGMKKGGITEKGTGEKYASKAAMMRHEKKESKAEEMKEHGMCGGGKAMKYASGGRMMSKGEHPVQKQSKRGAMAVKMARGGGCEVRGKTKGRMI